MKKPFLVVYDYGQGGVWAFVLARSSSDVEGKFPELKVVPEPPGWMSRQELSQIRRSMTFDIDREDGLLARIVQQRQHRAKPSASGHSGAG